MVIFVLVCTYYMLFSNEHSILRQKRRPDASRQLDALRRSV